MRNKYFLYETINRSPGVTRDELATEMKWTSEKVSHYIQKLLNDKIIRYSTKIEKGRIKKHYFPVSYKRLINWDEMQVICKK